MKKTYITPELLVVQLGAVGIICGSNLTDDGNGGLTGSLNDEDAEGPALTKEGRNLWSEDW